MVENIKKYERQMRERRSKQREMKVDLEDSREEDFEGFDDI